MAAEMIVLMVDDVGIPSGHPTIGVPDTAQLKAQTKPKKLPMIS